MQIDIDVMYIGDLIELLVHGHNIRSMKKTKKYSLDTFPHGVLEIFYAIFGEFLGAVSTFDFHLACLWVIKLIAFYFMGYPIRFALLQHRLSHCEHLYSPVSSLAFSAFTFGKLK